MTRPVTMRSVPRLLTLLLAATLGATLLVACPGQMESGETTTPPADVPDPVTIRINILGNRFDVESVAVPRGSTVIFHNTTSADHGVISDVFDADLRPGQDFSHTFRNPGTYHIRSRTHTDAPGLNCWVIVQ